MGKLLYAADEINQAIANSHRIGLQYVIAPSNAVNKRRADLILSGTRDEIAINAAFTDLAASRANSGIAVRVDFLGGDIFIGNSINIPTNFYVYFNGAKITQNDSTFGWGPILSIGSANSVAHIDGAYCTGGNNGIENFGTAYITNCICNNNLSLGIGNYGTATIKDCVCNENQGSGIFSDGTAKIIGCTTNANMVTGISSTGLKSIITENVSFDNTVNISVDAEGTNSIVANNLEGWSA